MYIVLTLVSSVLCTQISAEDAQRALKDLIFRMWEAEGCE